MFFFRLSELICIKQLVSHRFSIRLISPGSVPSSFQLGESFNFNHIRFISQRFFSVSVALNFVPILPEHSFKGRLTTSTDPVIIFPSIIDRTTVNLETAALTSSLARPFSPHWKYICPAPHCFTFWPGICQRADVGEVLKLRCLRALEAFHRRRRKPPRCQGKCCVGDDPIRTRRGNKGAPGIQTKDYFTVLCKGKEYCRLN